MESLGAGESSACRSMPFVDALKEQDTWILDIDLDFFATSNPFKGNFTEVIYNIVQKTTCHALTTMRMPKCFRVYVCCDSKHALVFICIMYVTPNMHSCLCVTPNMHSCLCVTPNTHSCLYV